MDEVTAAEARRTFADLLDRVEHGGEVAIVRSGRIVARLVPGDVPPRDETGADLARAAAARIRARARDLSGAPISVEEWAAFRDDGRR
ncbi:type II toxin-antitoxin system Phd/YefM family antitoxin [Oharaeibacter diazotrophicus]|uniref:Antitoxin n=1 Tax=Oharaeibacter diazotrophicus TaxID=1920512 RepID=A0A4R6RBR5_9HYPH|nr:type II toxin-antitoxin system prevent-host-death family antitoxin [Oharaeibacter diazotrophicus]TDP83435.1 prevent-host-death family protein [Oharaeibacter diazotrophicus]BBE72268.1 Phd_YefM protein [Pleomorphomonas sp. SM30]GLS79038.1 hypothetical protein GCM10007904_43750 [Oharaeibacter diazotrophicus]